MARGRFLRTINQTCESHVDTLTWKGSARTRRLTLWSSHLQATPHKLSFSIEEWLPPGSSEAWPTWSSLNRLRSGTGRSKALMQKWGSNEDEQTTCECGDEQTMKHMLVCPILPQPCTYEDLEVSQEDGSMPCDKPVNVL